MCKYCKTHNFTKTHALFDLNMRVKDDIANLQLYSSNELDSLKNIYIKYLSNYKIVLHILINSFLDISYSMTRLKYFIIVLYYLGFILLFQSKTQDKGTSTD